MNCDACVKIRNDSRTWHTHAASAAGAPLCSTEAGPRFALAADGVPASCKRCAAIQNGTMVLQLDAATKAPKKGNRK
jgi:hypothetical protein